VKLHLNMTMHRFEGEQEEAQACSHKHSKKLAEQIFDKQDRIQYRQGHLAMFKIISSFLNQTSLSEGGA
jgi:hypothetical protein